MAKKRRNSANGARRETADFDWADFLQSLAATGNGEGQTTPEIAAAVGHSEKWVRNRLRQAIAEDCAQVVRVRRTGLDGVTKPVAGYVLTSKARELLVRREA